MSTPFDEAPYLKESPRVVPVGEARQLFNDDYLILWSRSVARVHHRFAEVVRLEFEGDALLTAPPDLRRSLGCLIYVEKCQLKSCSGEFLGWRLCNPTREYDELTSYVCVYTSDDARHWSPLLVDHVIRSSNVVLSFQSIPNLPPITRGPTLDAEALYLLVPHPGSHIEPADLYRSLNGGIVWDLLAPNTGCLDECNFFYNPFRKVWSWSFRENTPNMDRIRRYQETASAEDSAQLLRVSGRYMDGDAVFWMLQNSNITNLASRLVSEGAIPPLKTTHTPDQPWLQIPGVYSLTGIPYESVMLVAATFFLGMTRDVMGSESNRHTINVMEIGVSRDGFHYSGFPDLTAAEYSPLVGLPALKSPNNYVTWTKAALVNDSHVMLHWSEVLNFLEEPVPYAYIAYQGALRRDGFASIGHEGIDSGSSEGMLLTHLLELPDSDSPMLRTLRVNVKCARGGELRTGMVRPINCSVDLQCLSRMMLPGFGIEESIPVTGDATDHIVLWAQPPWPMDYESAGAHHGTFHLLFQMRNCHLYSFWFEAGA